MFNHTLGGDAALSKGSTCFTVEPDFDSAVRINDCGGYVRKLQQLVKPSLLQVYTPFFVQDALASPRLAQLVADASTFDGVDDRNAGNCHRSSVMMVSVYVSGPALRSWSLGVKK